mmetsp:Transcript_26570/g.47901  ORF Transcript_26570/g.47901 Transcript_26570/m.47901 type:complete len:94 (+) Transcript_26570:64-345(+)
MASRAATLPFNSKRMEAKCRLVGEAHSYLAFTLPLGTSSLLRQRRQFVQSTSSSIYKLHHRRNVITALQKNAPSSATAAPTITSLPRNMSFET